MSLVLSNRDSLSDVVTERAGRGFEDRLDLGICEYVVITELTGLGNRRETLGM